ncbi:UDP-N-acetylmuramate dehydrogenase [candidate division KSB1 bacterium]
MKNTAYNEFENLFPDIIRKDVIMKDHTSIQIGGPADLFCEVNSKDTLLKVLDAVKKLEILAVLIGAGSNLLVDDKGFRGLIIKMISDDPPEYNDPFISASSGNNLGDILRFAAERSLSGLEFLSGIPGTVGGAVYMNAGAYGNTISDILDKADILDEELQEKTVNAKFFEFDYRYSVLQSRNCFVLSVDLRVNKGEKTDILKEYNRIISIREIKHPDRSLPCAGSYFKNLPPEEEGEHRRAAGYFLDLAGAKKMKTGGASVFEKHANIIVNCGNATSKDVLKLAEKMKEAVYNKFGIELEEEVRYLDSEKGIING